MNRPRPLPRKWLIVILLCATLIPPTFVVSFFLMHRPPAELLLDVDVELTVMRYEMPQGDNAKDQRLLSAVKVTNTGAGDYRNVAISLNKQFFYYHPATLKQGEFVEVPLEFFVTKGGSTKFQTGNKRVEQVTVFAQISSNARAVAERYFDASGQPKQSPKTNTMLPGTP